MISCIIVTFLSIVFELMIPGAFDREGQRQRKFFEKNRGGKKRDGEGFVQIPLLFF